MSGHAGAKRGAAVLLVEDNPADVELMRVALKRAGLDVRLEVFANGETALERLRGVGGHASAPAPGVVILDLNLPGMAGDQVLTRLRRDERLRDLPVFVLTSSDADEDRLSARHLDATGFLTKPRRLEGYREIIAAFAPYLGGARGAV